jgi:hypothetical protein
LGSSQSLADNDCKGAKQTDQALAGVVITRKKTETGKVQGRNRFPLARRLRKVVSTRTRLHLKADKSGLADTVVEREDCMGAEPAPEPECADPIPDARDDDRPNPEVGTNSQLDDDGDESDGQENTLALIDDPYSVVCDPYMHDSLQPYVTDPSDGVDNSGSDVHAWSTESRQLKTKPAIHCEDRQEGLAELTVAEERSLSEEPRIDTAELRREVAADIAKENLREALDEIHSERDGHAAALRVALLDFEERALRALGRVRDLRLQTEAASLSPHREESLANVDGEDLS